MKFNYKPRYTSPQHFNIDPEKNLFLIGTSDKGPINTPIELNEIGAEGIFGGEGSLIDAVLELKEAFNNDIYNMHIFLVKCSGEYASVNINGQFFVSAITTDARLSGSYVEIKNDSMAFMYPGLGITAVYYIYSANLIEEINNDLSNPAYVMAWEDGFELNEGAYYFSDPDPQITLTKNELFIKLGQTYNVLEGMRVQYLIPLEAYMDSHHPSFVFSDFEESVKKAILSNEKDYLTYVDSDGVPYRFYKQIHDFCLAQLNVGIMTTAIMGFSQSFNEYYSNDGVIKKVSNLYIKDIERSSFLLSAVYGNVQYANKIDSFYVLYGGLLIVSQSALPLAPDAPVAGVAPPAASLTNYELPKHLKYLDNFPDKELAFMFENGITTYRYSFLNDFVLFNNVTFTTPESSYFYFDDYKICFLVATRVNTFLKKHLGKNIKEVIDSHTLPRGIEEIFKSMQNIFFNEYEFSINLTRHSVTVPFGVRTLDNTHYIRAKASAPIN